MSGYVRLCKDKVAVCILFLHYKNLTENCNLNSYACLKYKYKRYLYPYTILECPGVDNRGGAKLNLNKAVSS